MLLGYARVSTQDQNLERQIDELNNAGCEKIFTEKITGAQKDRPELNKLISYARNEDTILVSELSRLSRSTKDLFSLIEQFENQGINLKSLKESWLDTSTAQGKLMFTIFAGLSQFERDLASQRTIEGLQAAKARGRNGGRPNIRNKKAPIVEALYKQGIKISDIVTETKLSRSTINRILKERL